MQPYHSPYDWVSEQEQLLATIRASIRALSSGVERVARPADAWLNQFATSPGAWRLLSRLLEAPNVQLNESFYAAHSLRTVCLKHQDVLEVVALGEFLPQLAYHLQTCLHRQHWALAAQLAAAIAALVARSPSLHPDALPQAVCNCLSSTVAQALADATTATEHAAATATAAATAAATAPQQSQSPSEQPTPTQSQWGYSGWHSNLGSQADPAAAAATAAAAAEASAASQEVLQLRLQQEPLVLAALLQVLAAMPDTLTSRQVVWYTFDRREAVKAGLLSAHGTTLVVAAALCSQSPRLVLLSCDTLAGLCELGSPPVGLEVQSGALQVLAGAVLSHVTCSKAADALAALAGACKGCVVAGPRWQLLQLILQQLQEIVFPTLTAQQEMMTAAQHLTIGSRGPGSAAPAAARAFYTALVGMQFGLVSESSFARMLCNVASALLTPVLQDAEMPEGAMDVLLQQLLLGIQSEDDSVAMVCVGFWQTEFVAQVQALAPAARAAALQRHAPTLEALAAALVTRTELKPVALATATADARDLPEEKRLMRRELAAAMRDVGKLVGNAAMLSYVVNIVATNSDTMKSHIRESGGPADPTPSELSPLATAACCKLEGGLYAANVVLGRMCDVSNPELVDVLKLLDYAADVATHHTKIHKLAGTALTLIGGLPAWLVEHTAGLPAVLTAATTALRSPDDKLARNAATCMQRLTANEELASLLFATQPMHVQELLQEYQRRGGLPVTLLPSAGDDQSTEELLLLALCSIAVAHSSSSNSVAGINSILAQLVGPQLSEASNELTAALQGNWPQQLPPGPESAALPQAAAARQQKRRGVGRDRTSQAPPPSTSKAVVCFQAVAKLIAGLPTGVHAYAMGVPLHTKHPRHQRMVQEVSRMLEAGPPAPLGMFGQPPPPPPPRSQQSQQSLSAAGTPRAGLEQASADDDSADDSERPSSPGGSSAQGEAGGGGSQLVRALHVGQGRQQPQLPLIRQQHACLFVSQLVLQALHSVTLAMQAAALAMVQPSTAVFGSHLLSAVSQFLQCALPAALHYDMLTAGRGASASAQLGETDPASTQSTADLAVLQPAALILQLCQMMEKLPVQLLQETSSLQLLLVTVTCAALAGALPGEECLDLEALRQPQPQQPQQPPDRAQQQLLMLLQRLVGPGLTAASQSIVSQQGRADDEHTAAALSVASVSVQRCPAVLVSVDMGLLFSMTLVACRTYHLKQVTALLEWVQAAVYAAYAQVQPMWDTSRGSSPPPSAAVAQAGVGFGRNLLAAMRTRLESGLGVELVLGLMLAASGGMPSDVVLPVALCLHAMWLTVGPTLFQAWLQAAVLQAAPESAPWARVRHTLKAQFVQSLTERSCLTDVTKFKGILKSFCGGRKKGPVRY